MTHKHHVEALHRTLRDVLGVLDVVFGGKAVVVGGGFRQVLPIIIQRNRGQIVRASLDVLPLWVHVGVHELQVNMRVLRLRQDDNQGSGSSHGDERVC